MHELVVNRLEEMAKDNLLRAEQAGVLGNDLNTSLKYGLNADYKNHALVA